MKIDFKSDIYGILLPVLVMALTISLGANAQDKDKETGIKPWVENTSLPYSIPMGLEGHHISLWASHGRYFDSKNTGRWRWQRPNLFTTNEDIFTQCIVTPFLIPMLENAGAIVFSPRERDWQTNESVIDNDGSTKGSLYVEVNTKGKWESTKQPGFALHGGKFMDEENPFMSGTARQSKATSREKRKNVVSYQPMIPEEGRYAVYVSYQTLKKSVDDAHYTVWHKGEPTTFSVNQQIGGGTWVYLGTFDFDKGCNEFNRVEISNISGSKGVVTTDAVRFGGGMGNTIRGEETSGLPRCLEGARYYAQWAGMPYSVYSTRRGTDDYADDINTRSLMTNYIGGGSVYMPDSLGLGVPIELSLAVHSDAGNTTDGSIFGSLGICTTDHNDGLLASGLSRDVSKGFAEALVANLQSDMSYLYGDWTSRGIWDRNYSETRLPNVPSAIIEMFSHQNFYDMKFGLDPNVQFQIARSIYKTILRQISSLDGSECVVEPLAPEALSVTLDGKGKASLTWQPNYDPKEPDSKPTAYVVYVSVGTGGFDNGTMVMGTSYETDLEPGILYNFKVASLNAGGKSFDSEVVSACFESRDAKTILIINGFRRLSGPHIVETTDSLGFDIDKDEGVPYFKTVGLAGKQVCFDPKKGGKVGEGALGYCHDYLAGTFIAGNSFDFISEHASAIHGSGKYNIISCGSDVFDSGSSELPSCDAIDLILGQQKKEGLFAASYKVISRHLMGFIRQFAENGGGILVSGSFVASGMNDPDERDFLSDVLKCSLAGTYTDGNGSATGMGTITEFHHSLNSTHYASTHSDILRTEGFAFPTMVYDTGGTACVAYESSGYKSITMGFPFECIKTKKKQTDIMRGFLNFLLK